jgi:hypothetical protein
VQQPANVRRVIPDPKSLLNQISHTRTGPLAGIQAHFLRQNPVKFPQGARIQPWRPAGGELRSQPLAAFLPDSRSPAPHTPSIHSHQPRHLYRGKPLRKQNQRAKSPPLQLFR